MPIAHIDLFRNALFNLFTLSADSYISLFLLFSRGEREGIIYTELTYFISFCVVMQHTSPLGKGRKRGITYTELTFSLMKTVLTEVPPEV